MNGARFLPPPADERFRKAFAAAPRPVEIKSITVDSGSAGGVDRTLTIHLTVTGKADTIQQAVEHIADALRLEHVHDHGASS